jgi:hypothetical protein
VTGWDCTWLADWHGVWRTFCPGWPQTAILPHSWDCRCAPPCPAALEVFLMDGLWCLCGHCLAVPSTISCLDLILALGGRRSSPVLGSKGVGQGLGGCPGLQGPKTPPGGRGHSQEDSHAGRGSRFHSNPWRPERGGRPCLGLAPATPPAAAVHLAVGSRKEGRSQHSSFGGWMGGLDDLLCHITPPPCKICHVNTARMVSH